MHGASTKDTYGTFYRYTPAISAILKNGYSFADKERFLHDFLAETEASSREEMKTVFEDKRARNRIQLLLNENPKLAPIYFLYTFFDYRQDHFCENIIEFGMRDAGFSNVTLSLWALLHGMTDIYAEYKNIEFQWKLPPVKYGKDWNDVVVNWSKLSNPEIAGEQEKPVPMVEQTIKDFENENKE